MYMYSPEQANDSGQNAMVPQGNETATSDSLTAKLTQDFG